jgi:hypothetical protein
MLAPEAAAIGWKLMADRQNPLEAKALSNGCHRFETDG